MDLPIAFFVFSILSLANSTPSSISVDANNWIKLAYSAALSSGASSECVDSLKEYVQIVSKLNFSGANLWALKMLDASAKIPEGIMYGATTDFGNFDECLALTHPSGKFTGQYCMLDIQAPSPFIQRPQVNMDIPHKANKDESGLTSGASVISWGLCLPSSCSVDDMRKAFSNETLQSVVSIAVDEANCYTSEHQPFSNGSWALISVFIVLVALALISTLYETYALFVQRNARPNKVLTSFSVYGNTKSLLEIRPSSGTGDMSCLHGIRALSMMWVMLCHTYLNQIMTPTMNLIDAASVISSADYTVITNGWFSVDSFFFLSGLLVAFVFFRNISSAGYFDVPVTYVHRYLRLTPVFMIMVVFDITLLNELTKGPIYHKIMEASQSACTENWWSSLLYVQNYVNPTTTCLGQSWYLSADMQMYWLSPLILYPLYLWPKIGTACLALLTLASTLWTFAIGYVGGYRASSLTPRSGPLDATMDQFANDYVATHTRMSPWLVGIAVGFAICVIKAKKITIRLTKTQVVTGWLLSAGVCLGCLYGIRRFFDDPSASDAENAIYLSFVRLGWGFGLSWVVFACIYGYGGVANSFLSLGIFQPLGKLSYNVYLVHETILDYVSATERNNSYFADFNMVLLYLGVFLLSNLLAAVLYLLVEAPIANLDKQLLGSLRILPYPASNKSVRDAKNTTKLDSAESGKRQG